MNLLFLGGAGFIGSSIIKRLQCQNSRHKIYVVEPSLASLSRLEGLSLVVYKSGIDDFDKIESILRINHIDKVIHLVSSMVPGSGYEDYKHEFENVVFPTVRIMQLCGRLGVQFVFFSSGGTVYGERKNVAPFVESDPQEPICYYGLSKQIIENSIQFEHRTANLNYLVIRPSNPYGPGQDAHGRQGLIAVALGKVLAGEPIPIWGDGSSIRDYIYIDDLADAVVQLIDKGVSNKIINVGSGRGYSINEVICIIKSIVSEEVRVEYLESRKNDVSNMVLCNRLMRKLVNLRPVSLEDGIRKFYLNIKDNMTNG